MAKSTKTTKWQVDEAYFRGYVKNALENIQKNFERIDDRIHCLDESINEVKNKTNQLDKTVTSYKAIAAFISATVSFIIGVLGFLWR